MKLKLSYSILSLWKRGDYDGVLDALNGKWREPNEYMKFGTEKHREWENEVRETGELPRLFGGGKLRNPITERYSRGQRLDWLWLSGITDLQFGENGEQLVDYKTGRGTANSYAGTLQAGCYKVLHPEAKVFRFLCWNQYSGRITTSMIFLTDAYGVKALDEIVSIACEIRDFLERSGMEDFNNVDKALKESENGFYEKKSSR